MKRLHLFEFGDQSWFPVWIRDYLTDYLQFVINLFGFYEGSITLLKKGLMHSGGQKVIDLASGGGGGWRKIAPKLQEDFPGLTILLTDYYPNIPAFEEMVKTEGPHFTFEKRSINALEVPEELEGFRTQFLSFHHFKPADARQILQNAVDKGAPIALFEAQERSISQLIQFIFTPIFVFLFTPFIRPFRLGRLIFTYLIPLVPLFIWWDGLVSVLRTYTVPEMKEMAASLDGSNRFEWEIGQMKVGQANVLYLLGYPK